MEAPASETYVRNRAQAAGPRVPDHSAQPLDNDRDCLRMPGVDVVDTFQQQHDVRLVALENAELAAINAEFGVAFRTPGASQATLAHPPPRGLGLTGL